MKSILVVVFSIALFMLCSCSMFYNKPPDSSPVASTPKPLAVPVGKSWQIVEEAPQLSDGSRLPFQTEKSLHPDVARPAEPLDNRKIETTR